MSFLRQGIIVFFVCVFVIEVCHFSVLHDVFEYFHLGRSQYSYRIVLDIPPQVIEKQEPFRAVPINQVPLEPTSNVTLSFYDVAPSIRSLLVVQSRRSQSKKKRKKPSVSKKELLNDQYPPDHVDYRKVEPVYKQINRVRNQIFQELSPTIMKEMERYSSLTTLLDQHVKPEMYFTPEEAEKLKTLHGSDRMKERQRLYQLTGKRKEENDKQLAEKRYSLLSILSHTEEGASACDGCEVPPTQVYASRSPVRNISSSSLRKASSRSRPTPILLRGFRGNVEMEEVFDTHHYRFPSDNQPFSVTAICVTTPSRLRFLRQVLYYWTESIVIVVYAPLSSQEELLHFVSTHFLPSRLTLLLYLYQPSQSPVFPVNLLRNTAIRNVQSSHFMVLDMDLWPTRNTFSEMQKIPTEILQRKDAAVILPAFFFDRKAFLQHCFSLESCALLAMEYMPVSKPDLVACVKVGHCHSSKDGMRTHMYVMPEWYLAPRSSPVSKIRCFITDFQEPYVLLRYHRDTPLFDEHFVNYGYNKVQLIEHLRAAGFQFFILNHAFAMDLPHPDSTFRKNYISSLEGEALRMRKAYSVFQRGLNTRYANVSSFKVCAVYKESYYTYIE